MQLITSNKRALATPDDPRCVAIANKHGDFVKFNNRWCPANLWHIANNVERSVEEGVPSLVMLMRTYGKESIQKNIRLHLGAIVAAMNITNEVDLKDIDMIPQLITESEPLRTLNYAFLLTFFAKVAQGEYKIYGGKPHQFMAALQEYARSAKVKQAQLQEIADKKAEAAEMASKQTMSFNEFAKLHGIDPSENPLTKLCRQ